MAVKKPAESVDVSILQIQQGNIEVCIKGNSPLILHCMSSKVLRELLYPKGRKSSVDKATTLKHNPIEEYRDSAYYAKGKDTALMLPAIMFKAAISNAALDMPGVKKAQIGRLVYVNGDEITLYGVPQLLMSVVRCSDINHTPDVRTRAILPNWACKLNITFVKPNISEKSVMNLLAAAGVITGVGDYRQQKGKSSYGQFELVSPRDKDFSAIVKTGGRSSQEAALETPTFYDHESEKLYNWFYDEYKERRGESDYIKLVGGAKA